MSKKKDWISKAVNPKHKGYCTPMTKSTCTPKRKAFAMTMKKHHGFHKAQDGAMVEPQPQDFPDQQSFYVALGKWANSQQGLQPVQMNNKNPLGDVRPISLQEKFDAAQQFPSVQQSMEQAGNNLQPKLGKAIPPQNKKKFNWGNAALSAMLLTDALIPGEPIKKPVVQPLNSYNPHPYGTNSQALAEKGITISNTGYKANSKDRNKPKLRIPSNQITMENVPHNVLGVDSLGNQQLMTPGNNYQFPGEYVDEFPLAKKGKKLKPKMGQYVSKSYEEGGEIAQNGKAIITNNPNDPRLKAYNDSLNAYTNNKILQDKVRNIVRNYPNSTLSEQQVRENIDPLEDKYITHPELTITKTIKDSPGILYSVKRPSGNMTDRFAIEYKKPVQPVVYQKPQQPPTQKTQIIPIKKGQPTYEDSMRLYNSKENQYLLNNLKKYGVDYNPRMSLNGKDASFIDENWKDDKIKPIAITKSDGHPIYKRPIGNPQPQRPKITASISNPTFDYPNMGETGMPNVQVPNIHQHKWDASQPTNWSFTNPTGSYLQQQTQYFPDEKSWKAFSQQQKNVSMQQMDGKGTATGDIKQYKKGGKIPKNVKIHDKAMTKKQRKFFQDICDMENGGKLQYTNNGLQIEDNQFTPISDETLQIQGNSHQNGGTDLMYAGKGIEAEAGETFHIDQEGNGVIMGNLKNPLTGNKFKNDSKMLARKEKKINKLMDYSTELVNKSNPFDKWDALKFNAGEAMMLGAKMKGDELKRSRAHLTDLQEAMLDLKKEKGENPPSKFEAAHGAKIMFKNDSTDKAQFGWHSYNGTKPAQVVQPTPASSTTELKPLLSEKYAQLQQIALTRLQALYPGRKVDIRMDTEYAPDGSRSLDNQMTLFKRGSTKTTVGLHNFAGAKDYIIYIDGKPSQKKEDYKNTLWEAAKLTGLQSGFDWDLGHIGAVEEGKSAYKRTGKTATERLFEQYPETKTGDRYTQTVEELTKRVKAGVADKTQLSTYRRLTGDKTSYKTISLSSVNTPLLPEDRVAFGENTLPKEYHAPTLVNPFANKTPNNIANGNPNQKGGPNPNYQYSWDLNETPEIPVGTDAEGLQFQQILPELYAAATNKEEPVWMQKYNPQLFQDHEISLQDRRNRVTSQGRASRQYLGDNAGAQAILAAGEYDALAPIDAEEFRINQQVSNDITNKNISLLNDATLKNLQLGDLQYTRQATAKSKTKKVNMDVLSSVSDKILQNQLENRTLQTYENLYPHFRYNDQYQLQKEGTHGAAYLNTGVFNPQNKQTENTATKQRIGADGSVRFTDYSTPSALDESLKRIKLQKERLTPFGSGYLNPQKLFNSSK